VFVLFQALLAEVNLQEPKISELAKLGVNTSRYKIVSNETDAMRSRWMTIQGGVEQQIAKLQRLETMWTEFNTKADQIETKLTRLASVKPVSGTLQQLENCLVELKVNEVLLLPFEMVEFFPLGISQQLSGCGKSSIFSRDRRLNNFSIQSQ
jgi:hypothetical protein